MPNDQQVQQWARQMQDVLADNAKIRENLTDDIAIPFIEWGREIAAQVATRLDTPDTPAPDEEQVYEAGYNLGRLMTRINWLVTYRTKKDAAWLTRTFAMVNKLSQDVYGADAPTLSDDEIAAWLADQPNHTEDEQLRDLMARYTPAALQAASAANETSPAAPDAPPSLLSNAAFGAPAQADNTTNNAASPAAPSLLSNAAFGAPAQADNTTNNAASPAQPEASESETTPTPPTTLSDAIFGKARHLSDAIFGSSHTAGDENDDEEIE
ncbi:MAG: hypothetical protein JXA10_07150 [Anaerolineae bacterium]|nr:hypothetical protein [Anaerolineae bacterium]